jgi:transposase-like protein
MRGMTKTTEAKWRRLIAAQEESGLTVREFAAARGITATTLYWWRSKLRRDGAELVPVEVVDHDEARDDDGTLAPWFELQVDSAMTLRVPPGFDEVELRRLLRAVRC